MTPAGTDTPRPRPARTTTRGPRDALTVAGVFVAALLLAGCTRAPETPSAGPGGPASDPAPAAPVRLVLMAMEDYVDDGILRQFEKETGVAVEHVIYEDPEEICSRLRSQPGSADLIIVDSFTIKLLRDLRLLCPLQKKALTNLGNVDPRHQGLSFDPTDDFCLPYHWGTTLLAYRKDLVPDPGRSWRLLWNPALKGRVMMLHDSFEPMAVAMMLHHINPQAPREADYILASDMMLEHLETMQARYRTDDQIKDALIEGTVSAAMCYSGDAAVAAAENPNIDFFIPEEGAMMWVDCLAICRDTQNEALAHQFLNFYLRPEIAARNASAINYAPTNRAAEPLIAKSLKNDPRLYPPPEVLRTLQHVPNLDGIHETWAHRYWHRLRSRFIAKREEEAAPRPALSTP